MRIRIRTGGAGVQRATRTIPIVMIASGDPVVPRVTRIGVLENPESDHVFGLYREDTERAARTIGFQLVKAEVRRPQDLDRGFERVISGGG